MKNHLISELKKLHRDAPAPDGLVEIVQTELGVVLPADYAAFMTESNGAAGKVGGSHLILYPLEMLKKINSAAKVDEFAPGLILFGADGGGTYFAFDTRTPGLSVVQVPDIGMSLDETEAISDTFEGFLQYLASGG